METLDNELVNFPYEVEDWKRFLLIIQKHSKSYSEMVQKKKKIKKIMFRKSLIKEMQSFNFFWKWFKKLFGNASIFSF